MDLKAMAKSKRSHTRHNQPRKPKPPSSSSSTSATASTQNPSDPKASKKQGKGDKKAAPQPPSLPSNWDRYEDEEDESEEEGISVDSGSGSPSRLAASKGKTKAKAVTDEVKPKSKGANFGELIAQAKESRSHCTPSFDDTLPELYQGLGPMLAVRSENILSWTGGDDFLGDDEATATPEIPFLSLDLKWLAEELGKVDLASRLFIEADLLPPELRGPEANEADNQAPFPEKQKEAVVADTFDELYTLYLEAEQEAERQQNDENKHSDKSSAALVSSSNPKPGAAPDVMEKILNDSGFPDPREKPLVSHDTEQDSGPSSGFEAVAAEAELDMLLGSFTETKLFDSPAIQSEVATAIKERETQNSFPLGNSATQVAPSQHSLGPSTTTIPVTSSLDDALDDLLEETSKPGNKDDLFPSTVTNTASLDLPSSSSSSLHPSSNSNRLEDFDSWLDTL